MSSSSRKSTICRNSKCSWVRLTSLTRVWWSSSTETRSWKERSSRLRKKLCLSRLSKWSRATKRTVKKKKIRLGKRLKRSKRKTNKNSQWKLTKGWSRRVSWRWFATSSGTENRRWRSTRRQSRIWIKTWQARSQAPTVRSSTSKAWRMSLRSVSVPSSTSKRKSTSTASRHKNWRNSNSSLITRSKNWSHGLDLAWRSSKNYKSRRQRWTPRRGTSRLSMVTFFL